MIYEGKTKLRSTSFEMALSRLEGLRRNVVELRQVRDKLKESVRDMKEKVKNFDKLYKEEVGPAKPEPQKGRTITPQDNGLERNQAKKSNEARKDVTKSAKTRVLRFIKCGFSLMADSIVLGYISLKPAKPCLLLPVPYTQFVL